MGRACGSTSVDPNPNASASQLSMDALISITGPTGHSTGPSTSGSENLYSDCGAAGGIVAALIWESLPIMPLGGERIALSDGSSSAVRNRLGFRSRQVRPTGGGGAPGVFAWAFCSRSKERLFASADKASNASGTSGLQAHRVQPSFRASANKLNPVTAAMAHGPITRRAQMFGA